jgi:hypothetical protein
MHYEDLIGKQPLIWPYPAFLTGFRSEAAQTGVDTRRATEGPAGVLDSTSRSPRERNAVDMPGCAAAVETL